MCGKVIGRGVKGGGNGEGVRLGGGTTRRTNYLMQVTNGTPQFSRCLAYIKLKFFFKKNPFENVGIQLFVFFPPFVLHALHRRLRDARPARGCVILDWGQEACFGLLRTLSSPIRFKYYNGLPFSNELRVERTLVVITWSHLKGLGFQPYILSVGVLDRDFSDSGSILAEIGHFYRTTRNH